MQPTFRSPQLWQRPGTGQLFTKALESQRPDAAPANQPKRLRVRVFSVESPWLLVLDR